eukprot:COSAG01_NODE_3897_length_5564_cov_3.198429_4_plen_125_part_00
MVSWAGRPLLLTGAEPHTLGTDTAANHTSQDSGGCTWATISLADGQARRHWPCLSLRARALFPVCCKQASCSCGRACGCWRGHCSPTSRSSFAISCNAVLASARASEACVPVAIRPWFPRPTQL